MNCMKYCVAGLLVLGIAVSPVFGIKTPVLPQIVKSRSFDTAINLANGGFIITPNEPDYKKIAVSIKTKLQTIAKTEYAIDSKFDIKPAHGQVIIAIGNMNNNPVIENLYWNLYTCVNPSFPGDTGYLIETVFQPLPFFARNNVIVIGASNPDMAQQAANAFIDGLTTEVVPPTLKIVGAKLVEVDPIRRKWGGLSYFRGLTDCFHLTGNKEHLYEAVKVLEQFYKDAEKNPDWILSWADEIDSFRIVCAWDFIQEHVTLSDADKLKYERFFLNLITRLTERSYLFGKVEPGTVAVWNHTSIPFIGMYASARYYQSHYGLDMQYILDQVKWYFDGQKGHYSVSCDSPGYAMFSLRFCIAYYSMVGDYEYFDNGNARKMCELYFSQLDNNGYLNGVGDIRPNEIIKFDPAWDVLDWRVGFPELFWFRKQAKCEESLCSSKFRPDAKPQRPDYLAGCVSIPTDEWIYELTKKGEFKMPRVVNVPLEKTFNKLQFRSFTPQGGEYLLVDGFGSGNHGHFDTAAIITCTLDGYKFLIDSEYLLGKSSEHSMVIVLKDGQASSPVPPFAELVNKINFDDGAYTCTKVKNYNDSAWDRHILWLKDRYFAVLDVLKAEQAGEFKFDCIWKVLDRGMEDFDGTEIICKAPCKDDPIRDFPARTFHLQGVDAGWRDHRICEDDGKSWKIHQAKTLDMKKDDITSYQNIFYVERAPVKQYKPVKLTDTVMRIAADDNSVIVVGSQRTGGLEINADFVYASPKEVLLVNAGQIKDGNDILFDSNTPATVWLKKDAQAQDANAIFRLSELILSKFHPQPKPVKKTGEIPAQLKPLWQFGGNSTVAPERDLVTGDINADNKPEILFCADKNIFCLDANGSQLWKYEHKNDIYSCLIVNWGDIMVLAGTEDGKILALNSGGGLVKAVEVKQAKSGKYGMQKKHWITNLSKKDLNSDGKDEIVAGLRSWQVHVFDSNLSPIWHNSLVLHGVTDVSYGSVKRTPGLIYVGDIYGGAYIFDISKDKSEVLLRKVLTNVGATYVLAYDINKDGTDDVITASECGRMVAGNGTNFKSSFWSSEDYGYGYSSIKIIPKDEPLLAASSLSGYIHIIDAATGRIHKLIDAGEPISTFELIGDRIIAGTQSGFIVVMDMQGSILGKSAVSNGVLKIKPVSRSQYAVLTSDGQVSLFALSDVMNE